VSAADSEDASLTRLRARVVDHAGTGGSDLILAPEAMADADAVLAGLDWSTLEHCGEEGAVIQAAVLLVVAFHRYRAKLLPGQEGARELKMASELILTALRPARNGTGTATEPAFPDLTVAPAAPMKFSLACHNVAMRVVEHAERMEDAAAAAQAVRLFERCAAAADATDPHRDAYNSNLGLAYSRFFDYTGDRVALTAAIGAFRRARELTRPQDGRFAVCCTNLGVALVHRFELTDHVADLDEAIDVQTAAVEATARTDPDFAFYQSNLGASHTTRFERTADRDSLDLAIHALQAAVAATPEGDPELPTRETNLGRARLRRYEQTADTDSLFAAIAALGAAVEATAPDDPDYEPRLSNLAGAFILLYDRTRDLPSLDMAIEALEEATTVKRPHRLRASHLANLGTARQRRFGRTHDSRDAETAIEAYTEALNLTPPDDPDRVGRLSGLGNLHLRRGTADDLDRALALLDEAVGAVPRGHPDSTVYLTNRADAYAARFERSADDTDLAAALRDYRAAAEGSAPALGRARAALSRGRLAASADPGHPEALDGFGQAVGLLDQVVWRGLSRTDGEFLLREFSGVASDAAACAIARGRPAEEALDVLDRGRGVLLGHALDTRAAYDTLREEHPDLAERFSQIQRALERPDQATSLSEQYSNTASLMDGEQFVALAREREEVLAAIQALPGHAGFPRSEAVDLEAAAAAGPVVVVNVSRYRCDALALTDRGVLLIPLPALTADDVARVAEGFLRLVRRVRIVSELSTADRRRLDDRLRDVLAWLWEVVAAPVLDRLGLGRRERDWPRLWWCPTRQLGLLPLHCAQRYDPDLLVDDGVVDRVAPSYTPTLRALVSARRRVPTDAIAQGLLAVTMATTPGLPPLPGTDAEIAAMETTLAPTTTVPTDRATKATVTELLRSHRWLHYIGHSAQDLEDPGGASLFLQDGRLTMREIAAMHLDHAEFAYLSSCESSLGGTALADEAPHLAGALGMAGFRHVVATSWAIRDDSAAHVTRETYRRLTDSGTFDPDGAGRALHHTLREIRNEYPLLVAAAYSHTGP